MLKNDDDGDSQALLLRKINMRCSDVVCIFVITRRRVRCMVYAREKLSKMPEI